MTKIKDDTDTQEEMKFLEAVIQKDASGNLVAIASTNSVDRMNEVIDNNGWELKNYQKNPVILWAHDHTEPAIGTSARTWVEGVGSQAKLMIEPVLHDVTERARAIKKLVEMGVIKTLSVGFKPLDISTDGKTLLRNELLENSFCNVPANADAQMLAYKTLRNEGFSEKTLLDIGISTKVLDRLAKLEKDVTDLQSLAAGKIPSAPKAKVLGKRQMLAKAITRAADLLAEGDKNKSLTTDKQKDLVRIIKRAGDKIAASQKAELRNG